MDYQFIAIVVGIITLFFTIVAAVWSIKSELNAVRNIADSLKYELNEKLDSFEIKQTNTMNLINSRLDAVYNKLDNLLWRSKN